MLSSAGETESNSWDQATEPERQAMPRRVNQETGPAVDLFRQPPPAPVQTIWPFAGLQIIDRASICELARAMQRF
jgi:hypothetical protein